MTDDEWFLACWDWMDNQPMIFYLIDVDEAGGAEAIIAQEMRGTCYDTYAKHYQGENHDE